LAPDCLPSIEPQALLDAIHNRRSVSLSRMKPDDIDLETIGQMLEAARWAPNHGLTEPWRFTVYSGEGRRALGDAFAAAYRALNPGDKYNPDQEKTQRDRVWQAPVWIAVGMYRDENPKMPEWEDMVSVGTAVYIMHLTAYAHGLGGKWSSGAVSNHPTVADFVGYTGATRLLGFFYVGEVAGDWPTCMRQPMDDKVRWVGEAA